MLKDETITIIEHSIDRFLHWLNDYGFYSYDQFDLWASKVGIFSKKMFYKSKILAVPLVVTGPK